MGIGDKDEIIALESSRGGGVLMADISNERGLVKCKFRKMLKSGI